MRLLPCPFCGSTRVGMLMTSVKCDDCKAIGPRHEAEVGWNRRTPTAPPEPTIWGKPQPPGIPGPDGWIPDPPAATPGTAPIPPGEHRGWIDLCERPECVDAFAKLPEGEDAPKCPPGSSRGDE